MQNITIICVGKLKEKYLKDAACEYAKRLSSYCKLNIVEIDEERLPDRLSENVISAAMEKEAERIEEKIPAGAYTIALCIEGKQLSSQEFSTIFEKTALEGFSNLAFIIGGFVWPCQANQASC